MILIDNESSVDICPLKTVKKLGLSKEDMNPSTKGLRAYGFTHQTFMETISFCMALGGVKGKVVF